MPSLDASYSSMVAALADHYDLRQRPVEEDAPFEAVLGVGLSKAADQARVAAAIKAWAAAGMLDPRILASTDPAELIDVASGEGITLPTKAAALAQRLARWFSAAFPDDVDELDPPNQPTTRLRADLLAVRGIGQPTADAILLALGRPCYPVDHGTYRILLRHGWIDQSADYDEVHQLLNRQAGGNPAEIARLSGWLVRVSRQHCGLASPKCNQCPLREFLPETGPLEPDG